MIVLSWILLALALVTTLLYFPVAVTLRPVSGPDSMGLIGVIFLSAARWICLGLALTIAALSGQLPWIHPGRGLQWLAVLACLAVVITLELWSVTAATGWFGKAARPWVTLYAVIVPLFLIVVNGTALLRAGETNYLAPRVSAGILFAFMSAGAVVLAIKNVEASRETRAHRQAAQAESDRAYAEKQAAFRALRPDSPLEEWLAYTRDSDDAIRDEAVRAIRSRPGLNEELAAILRSPEPLPALRWLWLWMPDPPGELAGPLHEAATSLPAWAARRLDDPDASNDGEVGTACEALVVVVDAFPDSEVDFRQPLEEMRSFLDSRALPEERMGEDRTYAARSMLNYWFGKHP